MSADHHLPQRTVLLCVTGCIAAYKACEVTRLLQKAGLRVKVLMTDHATRFIGPTTFRALTHEKVAIGLFDDPEDPIHHISLAQEADLVLVAPATANVIAKMAHGIADDLMSTTLLATDAPVLIAPAMNTGMWIAAATQENIAVLRRRGCRFVEPASGRLACGDIGAGKLADVEEIAAAALDLLDRNDSLAGERVLVTAGGTQEAIDPVRYIGNRSSGKFGYAIAEAARAYGAKVTLISGPTSLVPPTGVEFVPVVSARDMLQAASDRFEDSSVFISAAAVADYTPRVAADHKLKKSDERLDRIDLVETKDILAAMSARKGDRTVIGFAAETHDLIRYAQDKLDKKGCDAILANDVSRADSTFGSDTDKIWWVSGDGVEEFPCLPKPQVARLIMDRVSKLRAKAAHEF